MTTNKEDGGYIYFINKYKTNLYKIGYTANLKRRMQELKRQSPETIITILYNYYEKKEALRKERELLNMFPHRKKKGEWFNLSPEEVKVVKSSLIEDIPEKSLEEVVDTYEYIVGLDSLLAVRVPAMARIDGSLDEEAMDEAATKLAIEEFITFLKDADNENIQISIQDVIPLEEDDE